MLRLRTLDPWLVSGLINMNSSAHSTHTIGLPRRKHVDPRRAGQTARMPRPRYVCPEERGKSRRKHVVIDLSSRKLRLHEIPVENTVEFAHLRLRRQRSC